MIASLSLQDRTKNCPKEARRLSQYKFYLVRSGFGLKNSNIKVLKIARFLRPSLL